MKIEMLLLDIYIFSPKYRRKRQQVFILEYGYDISLVLNIIFTNGAKEQYRAVSLLKIES